MAPPIKFNRKSDTLDWDAKRHHVSLFRPLGSYPKGTYCTPTGLFHADNEIVFAVTYGARWPFAEHLPYSEVDWLEPEQVRLLGSLMLAEDLSEECILCRFYPMSYGGFIVDTSQLDLTRPETAEEIRKLLMDTVNDPSWPPYVQDVWRKCLGANFHLFEPANHLCVDQQRQYWHKMSTKNHVLMRGLQALIKSDMLASHQEFQEEAAIATFIALEASFELVRRYLRRMGIAEPTAKDAGEWLHRTFDEPLGYYGSRDTKYFEEFYTQRIQTVHPGNRFGDAPYAPVMVDDYIHLRSVLPQVFGYLLLGKHSPKFLQNVAERKATFDKPRPPCGENEGT
jgi:hypothetical protein